VLQVGLVAANLRPPLVSVGPALGAVRRDLELSPLEVSVITSLPVLCCGLLAPFAPYLHRRFGIERVLGGVLIVSIVGLTLRVSAGASALFMGTAVLAGAIALSNVLVPALIKRDFPHRLGLMMGVYTMILSGSAAVAAGATVPLADLTGSGWRAGLGIWALPACIALFVWIPRLRPRAGRPAETETGERPKPLVRSALAWQVTAFMGLQSLGFYAVIAWLPSIFESHGYSAGRAGLLLSLSALVQAPVSLLLPRFAVRAADQRWHAAAATAVVAVGVTGLLIAPTWNAYLWACLIGIGQGAAFALAMTFLVLRAGTSEDTARLSAMTATFGYLIAATGPLAVGVVYERFADWSAPLYLLLALLAAQLFAGVLAGRARTIRPSG
jgi:CP family cyanate transporter-like MFS transporter